MNEDFDYKQVPFNYTHCLHSACPRSASCLRFLITGYASSKVISFTALNPARIIGKENECPYFQQDELSCFALGITNLFDNIPYKQALKLKKKLYFQLKRNTYYRIQRKERLINPAELSLIRKIFKNEGIKEEPLFDELIYKYTW